MTRYIRNSKTISGRLHDEMVMMDMDQGKYFSLNQTATVIWEMLENPMTIEDICTRLAEDFEVDMRQCREDVLSYLEEMTDRGLISEEKG